MTALSEYFLAHQEAWIPGMAIRDPDTGTVFRCFQQVERYGQPAVEWIFLRERYTLTYLKWTHRDPYGTQPDFERAHALGPWLEDPATVGTMLMAMPEGSVSRCAGKDTGWDAEYNLGTGWRVFHDESREQAVVKAFLDWKEGAV